MTSEVEIASAASSSKKSVLCLGSGRGMKVFSDEEVEKMVEENFKIELVGIENAHLKRAIQLNRHGKPEEAREELLIAAEEGDLLSGSVLAEVYRLGGYGMEEDSQKCLLWMQKSIDRGFAPSCAIMARIFKDGLMGIDIDDDKANELGQKALALSLEEPNALYRSFVEAYCAYNGLCEKEYKVANQSQAVEWYQKCVEERSVFSIVASYNLAYCKLYGTGTNASTTEAFR